MKKRNDTLETIVFLESEKSNFLLKAQMLTATGNPEGAIERFALAASLEGRIAEYYINQQEPAEAARHWFSAAVCHAKTGNLYSAIARFDELSRSTDTPGRLKIDALLFASRLREQQRNALFSASQILEVVA